MNQFERIVLYYVLPIVVAYAVAVVLQYLAVPVTQRLLPGGRDTKGDKSKEQHNARRQTLVGLISGTIKVTAYLVATFVSLAQFVSVDTLVWMVGLFGAGLGFSAKPFISDYMTGIAFITDDTFDIGEKVEINGIEGVIEQVDLRLTRLRGINGEAYIIPNGEIRTVRNFSRGRFTPVKLSIRVSSADIPRTIPILETLGHEVLPELPDLLEPWQVLTENATLGNHSELTLSAKAAFGKGAKMRPKVLTIVQERLTEEGIALTD